MHFSTGKLMNWREVGRRITLAWLVEIKTDNTVVTSLDVLFKILTN